MTNRMVPGTRYVDTTASYVTGGSGIIYIHIDAIVAIRELDSDKCHVLLSGITDWLQVNVAAMALITMMKEAP